ncbi:MAG: ABC transporter permease, partial [Candidatus Binatia bacterium]
MAVAELRLDPLDSSEIESPFRLVARRFIRHKLAIAGLTIVAIFVFLAIFADVLAPYDPLDQALAPAWSSPSPEHLLGTDDLGR